MNTKAEEALGAIRDVERREDYIAAHIEKLNERIAQQDATIARLERGLATIRDSTFRNAVTLRGMADYTLNQEQVK